MDSQEHKGSAHHLQGQPLDLRESIVALADRLGAVGQREGDRQHRTGRADPVDERQDQRAEGERASGTLIPTLAGTVVIAPASEPMMRAKRPKNHAAGIDNAVLANNAARPT
jgi:hypothetical protein